MCDLVHWTVWLLFACLIVVPIAAWAIKKAKKSIDSIKE